MLFMSCVCDALESVHCCHVVTCWERIDLLALVCDDHFHFVTFACGFLGQVWYLIVLIPGASFIKSFKVSKDAKIRNHTVPHSTQDTNGKVTNSQLYTTNESQEVSPLPEGDRKAQINRRLQRHCKHKPEKKNTIKDPQKKYRLGTVSLIFYWRA